MADETESLTKLGKELQDYCTKYSIPIEYFFEIINDQKVVPMLRGKGMEYSVYLLLSKLLNSREWVVTKLNLSAQPGILDKDISITHRRTGMELIVESKSAVRDSITTGVKARTHKVPHFKVKCHRSRSNTKKETNDRYAVTDFDIIVTNPSNAIIKGGTVGEDLEIIDDQARIETLYTYYNVSTPLELLQTISKDWRFVLSSKIAENGFIPRTPTVYLENDVNWLPLNQLQAILEGVVRQRVQQKRSGGN
jgi:hypothetical protein